jgi:integrase
VWRSSVRSFVQGRRGEHLIGELWARRTEWELLRVPTLAHRVEISAPIRAPADVTADYPGRLKQTLLWQPATFRVHFAALRAFLRWAGNSLADRRPAWAVPSGAPSHRRWLDRETVVRLYRAAKGRERLLIGLEAFNGLRRVEVLRLRGSDILLGQGLLNVLGKGRAGGKWRQVPITKALLPALRRATESVPASAPVLPLSRSGADLLLQRAAARAGFPGLGLRVSHHDLRRTFGRLAHRAGMDLVQLKNLYGHTSLDQTVHYIGLDAQEMRRGLDRLEAYIGPAFSRPRGAGPERREP